MASNIVLKTYKGGSVTPQDDAIIHLLSDLEVDEDVNYNDSSYDMELATFQVSRTGILNLEATFETIKGASGGGSGASTLQRSTAYEKGDFATCQSTPGWVTLYCTQSGETADTEPAEYSAITDIGTTIQDGTCVFDGCMWAYLVDAAQLVCVSPTGTTRLIPVTGAETLSGTNPVYLSICGGSLYLTQIGGTQSKILLFELVSFTGQEESVKMTEITTYISSKVVQTANQYTIPYVVDVGGTKMMTLYADPSTMYYVTWKAGQYTTSATSANVSCGISYSLSEDYTTKLDAKFGFS
jgi:hypothetical protein